MNDLSGLAFSNLMPRIRHDLFGPHPAETAAFTGSTHFLEKCDSCGAYAVLREITFTGRLFVCSKCMQS